MSTSHGTATTSPLSLVPLDGGDASDFGLARVRDLAFDAVIGLWRRRRAEGMTQRDLLKRMRSNPATLSRNLRAPGNWTMRTFGELVQALGGRVTITVEAVEDVEHATVNHDAYDGYAPVTVLGEKGPSFVFSSTNWKTTRNQTGVAIRPAWNTTHE